MNEVEKTLAAAREAMDAASRVYISDPAACEPFSAVADALSDLITALDASGVLQDAARWQWFTDDLERNHGVSRKRINASTDATMLAAREAE